MSMDRLRSLVEHSVFQAVIIGVIILNSILFGIQTSPSVSAWCGPWLSHLDDACLAVFTIELVLKLVAYNWRFCRDPWNLFDFIVVAVSFVPDMGMFSAVRLFRILRIFKLISGIRHMRIILAAIVKSVKGIMWTGSLLMLIYYVYAILGTHLFGAAFGDWFGSLGKSVYSLFQIMTLESWSMGIARPVIAVYPYAWIYFVSYILLSSFVVMNVVVGIVLTSISDCCKREEMEARAGSLQEELAKLKEQIAAVEVALEKEKESCAGRSSCAHALAGAGEKC